LTTGLYSTTYDLQFYPIPPLSGPKLAYLRWGGRGAPPDPPSSHTITTTVDGGWFLTTGLYSTTYDLQFYPIPPLSGPKLAYLRWGGRGAPPDPPSSHTITTTVGGGWFLTTGLYSTTYDLQFYPIPMHFGHNLGMLREERAPPGDPRV
jgi:hypothetical protein